MFSGVTFSFKARGIFREVLNITRTINCQLFSHLSPVQFSGPQILKMRQIDKFLYIDILCIGGPMVSFSGR